MKSTVMTFRKYAAMPFQYLPAVNAVNASRWMGRPPGTCLLRVVASQEPLSAGRDGRARGTLEIQVEYRPDGLVRGADNLPWLTVYSSVDFNQFSFGELVSEVEQPADSEG